MFQSLGVPELVFLALPLLAAFVVIWPASRILTRAGFSPWLGILSVVPLANIVLLWFVAMSPWRAGAVEPPAGSER